MKTFLNKVKNTAWLNKLGIAAAVAAGLILYLAGATIQVGWATYALQLPSLLIIAITALVRVNDISQNKRGAVWNLRRIGLSFAGAGAFSYVFTPWMGGEFPSWASIILSWGFALTWITTPDQPPWWKKITRYLGEGT